MKAKTRARLAKVSTQNLLLSTLTDNERKTLKTKLRQLRSIQQDRVNDVAEMAVDQKFVRQLIVAMVTTMLTKEGVCPDDMETCAGGIIDAANIIACRQEVNEGQIQALKNIDAEVSSLEEVLKNDG